MLPLSVGVIGVVTHKNVSKTYPNILSSIDKNQDGLLCRSPGKHVCGGTRALSLEDYFKRILDGDFTKSKSVPKHEDIRGSVSSD